MLNSAGAILLALSLQQNAPTPDRPITRLFQNLAHDVAALPSTTSAKILAVGGTFTLAARYVDRDVEAWAERRGESMITLAGQVAGDGWVQGSLALSTYLIGVIGRQERVTHVGSDLIRAHVLNGLVTSGLKIAVNRARPTGSDYSFPSGHTSAAFVTASVLDGHYGWRVGVPMYALSSFIAWSRVRDREHWLSDVVFGATIGTMIGRTVTKGHWKHGWSVTPAKTEGGLAVFVSRTW